MDAKSNGTDIGEAPTSSQWNDIIGEWNNNTHAEEICKAAMDKLGIGEDEIADYLSGYGSQDYGECFAEAISEVGSCEEPREFSKAIEEEYENYKNSISKEDSSLVEATNSDLTNGAIQEKEKHISETEAREAFENKFHEIASGETSWNTPEKQESFLNTVDAYAERAVNEGAVESKTDFYEQYANRDYHYPAEYVDKIKEPFLNTGASSIVNQNAVINAFDAYGTIGRGTDGNFVTSIADDSRLCFDGEKAKDAETISFIHGGKYRCEKFIKTQS